MKYIIKNCNCFILSACCAPNADRVYCKDITDCLLKRIVDEYKKEKIIKCNIDGKEQILKAYHHTRTGDKILELLEIEEVNE